VSASLNLRDTPALSPHSSPQAAPHLENIITAEYRDGDGVGGSTKQESYKGQLHSKDTQNYVCDTIPIYISVLQQTDIAMVSCTLMVSPL
jgi:hypothetical protein